jgi:hypothetical protein
MIPADVLDLSRWKVTLPTGAPSKPTEIKQPLLATFSNPHFCLDGSRTGVVFTAPVGGVTTSGSKYPRCELREMNADGSNASWDSTRGVHTLTVIGAVTALPPKKPQVIIGQVHDASKLVVVEVDGSRVVWKTTPGPFNPIASYALGDHYCFQIVAVGGVASIYWNGGLVGEHPHIGQGNYFKAGAYGQSNLDFDLAPAASQAVIYELVVTHQ